MSVPQAVCIAIIHSDGKQILSVSRKHNCHDWGLPGGKVEQGESLLEAISREVEEEVGLQLNISNLVPVFTLMAGSHLTTTFLYPFEHLPSQFIFQTQETGHVGWRPFSDVLKGTFGDYNKGLLHTLDLISQKCHIVLGAQFGDEGKGKLVDSLVSKLTQSDGRLVCVRINGGSNAGHTVKVDGKYYYSHLLPSGVITSGVVGLLGNGVVVNLRALFKEIAEFKVNGVDVTGRLLISNRAHITTLLHCLIDEIEGRLIGTTKQGIGPTYADKMSRKGLRMDTLLDANWTQSLETLYEYHKDLLKDYFYDHTFVTKDSDGHELRFTSKQSLFDYDQSLIQNNLKFLTQIQVDIPNYLNQGNNPSLLIEGANATMLDIEFGTYPYVTSSSCSVGGVITGSGLSLKALTKMKTEVIGVTKIYITRVGGGTLPTELDNEIGQTIQKRGGEVGVTTGRIRRCGWLDLPQLKYSCQISGFDCLNLTKLDVLNFLDEIQICIKYVNTQTGEEVKNFPSNEMELTKVTPIYQTFQGWKDCDFSTCHQWSDLPESVKMVVEFIENYTQTPIKYINTGQERDAIIIRQLQYN